MRNVLRITALGLMVSLSACGQPSATDPPAGGMGPEAQARLKAQGYQVQQYWRNQWYRHSAMRRRFARESAIEAAVFTMVNDERAKAGLPALERVATLNSYANIYSIDMGTRHFFDHTNPDGKGTEDRLKAAGITFSHWGENLRRVPYSAESFQDIAQRMMYEPTHGWMNSQIHKDNILSAEVTQIGIGVYEDASTKQYYATQIFIRP